MRHSRLRGNDANRFLSCGDAQSYAMPRFTSMGPDCVHPTCVIT
jgi:hypothetical protein